MTSLSENAPEFFDHRGLVLAKAGQGESMAANAEIDLAALRRARRTPEMGNLLPRQRFELYASSYARTSVYPPNTVRPCSQSAMSWRFSPDPLPA